MKRIVTLASVFCAALVVGCASTQTADVSPGVVANSAGSAQACCGQCPAKAAQLAADQTIASPGAVSACSGAKAAACKASAQKQCPFAAAKAAGQGQAISPGAVSDAPRCSKSSRKSCSGR